MSVRFPKFDEVRLLKNMPELLKACHMYTSMSL
jgi:hypothetical protein